MGTVFNIVPPRQSQWDSVQACTADEVAMGQCLIVYYRVSRNVNVFTLV